MATLTGAPMLSEMCRVAGTGRTLAAAQKRHQATAVMRPSSCHGDSDTPRAMTTATARSIAQKYAQNAGRSPDDTVDASGTRPPAGSPTSGSSTSSWRSRLRPSAGRPTERASSRCDVAGGSWTCCGSPPIDVSGGLRSASVTAAPSYPLGCRDCPLRGGPVSTRSGDVSDLGRARPCRGGTAP